MWRRPSCLFPLCMAGNGDTCATRASRWRSPVDRDLGYGLEGRPRFWVGYRGIPLDIRPGSASCLCPSLDGSKPRSGERRGSR